MAQPCSNASDSKSWMQHAATGSGSADMLPSILLVDDDELSRRLVSGLLASCGYQGVQSGRHHL